MKKNISTLLWLPQVLASEKIVGKFTFDEQNNLLAHNVEIVATLPGEQSES